MTDRHDQPDDAPRRKRPSVKVMLDLLVRIVVLGAAGGLVTGIGAGASPLCDLATHFQVQYLCAGVVGTLLFVVLCRWRWVMVAAVCAIAQL